MRLGTGVTLNRVPTSLRCICKNVIEEMQAVFPNQTFQMDGDNELTGEWDEDRLDQVISNLVSNAVQHGGIGSPVIITAKSIGDRVEVSVHNEGIPIPRDMIPKLFDAFYRNNSRDADTRSTSLGLGLYIAKVIVAHGGTIEVRSSADEGTTFTVRLPSA